MESVIMKKDSLGQGLATPGHLDFVEEELARRRSAHRLRTLRPLLPDGPARMVAGERSMVNFCSNDYLGLSQHPEVIRRSRRYTALYGAGSGASRLITGTFTCMDTLEKKLAQHKGMERALVFNSGFQANVSILPALADKNSLILSDALNHASIIAGARLARCRIEVVPHNDPAAFEKALVKARRGFSRVIIATESVFSMDGDTADIAALAELAHNHGALLYVDEAHATGVLGERGAGLCRGLGVDVVMGTCGKALGSFGAFAAVSEPLYHYLVNRSAGLIYSTALPPGVIGAIDAALDLVPEMDAERERLAQSSRHVRDALAAMGYDTGASQTQIIPIIVGDEKKTLDLSACLEAGGLLALAIRPPTVEPGKSRIRLTISSAHTSQDIERLLEVFKAA